MKFRAIKSPTTLAACGAFLVPEPLGICCVLAAGIWWLCRKMGGPHRTLLSFWRRARTDCANRLRGRRWSPYAAYTICGRRLKMLSKFNWRVTRTTNPATSTNPAALLHISPDKKARFADAARAGSICSAHTTVRRDECPRQLVPVATVPGLGDHACDARRSWPGATDLPHDRLHPRP